MVVLLFTCFPPAFARPAVVLHLPLSLMLIGIVLRGSAFTFRSHYGRGPGDAAGPVSLVLWGWALGPYPYLVPPDLAIRATAAPRITLVLVLWALAAGALVPFPSLVYRFRVFKRQPA